MMPNSVSVENITKNWMLNLVWLAFFRFFKPLDCPFQKYQLFYLKSKYSQLYTQNDQHDALITDLLFKIGLCPIGIK